MTSIDTTTADDFDQRTWGRRVKADLALLAVDQTTLAATAGMSYRKLTDRMSVRARLTDADRERIADALDRLRQEQS